MQLYLLSSYFLTQNYDTRDRENIGLFVSEEMANQAINLLQHQTAYKGKSFSVQALEILTLSKIPADF